MNLQDLRVVFLGTPDFAVASLEKLVQNGVQIVGVVTTPDKPSGRGQKLHQSAVKEYAVKNGLYIMQPEKLRSPHFINDLKALNADIQIVVAFRMLPEIVWNMPPLGTLNVHASLLPDYRGAAPINWAIINGENITGVTIFKLKHEIDTGDILNQRQVDIENRDNAGTLYEKLKIEGASLLLDTLKQYIQGSINILPQDDNKMIHIAPKIFKEDCLINWNNPAIDIYNFIRGLSPIPSAYSFIDNKLIKIFDSEIEYSHVNETPGSILTDNKTFLKFAAIDGYVSVKIVQLEGKKRMPISDFLRGFKLKPDSNNL